MPPSGANNRDPNDPYFSNKPTVIWNGSKWVDRRGDEGQAIISGQQEDQSNALIQELLGISQEQLKIQSRIAEGQLEIARRQQDIADARWDWYVQEYQPLEKNYLDSVQVGIDPEFHADRAAIDVRESYEKSKDTYVRDMGRYGVDPTSGRFQGIMSDFDILAAAAEAGAKNETRLGVEDMNRNREYQAISLGRGLPSEAATIMSGSAQTSSRAGQSYNAGFSNSMNTVGNIANLYDQRAQGAISRSLGQRGVVGSGSAADNQAYASLAGTALIAGAMLA